MRQSYNSIVLEIETLSKKKKNVYKKMGSEDVNKAHEQTCGFSSNIFVALSK